MAGCAAPLRVTLFVLIAASSLVHSESHWDSYTATVQSYRWTCFRYYYTYCVSWNYYGYYLGYQGCGCQLFRSYASYCYTLEGYNCFANCLGWTQVTLWRCSPGWKGANCDIPICDSPSCSSNQVCVRPNTCECLRSASTGECVYAPCSTEVNCYPGSCNAANTCICPPGFTGPNCLQISNTPDINSCSVQVLGTPNGGIEQVVAGANECAAPGLDPLPIWIGASAARSLTKILVTWDADYSNQLPLPDRGRAPYVNNAPVPIGIVESNFTVSFLNQNNFSPRSASCISIDPVNTDPQRIKKCSEIMPWTDLGASSLITTNATFVVSIEAQVGGAKKGDQSQTYGRFGTQVFSKAANTNTTVRTAKFAFDLEPPYHCLSISNNCSVFPIFLNQTMTSNPVIQPTFNAWNDDGSGISRFHVDVFFMQPDQQGQLVELGDPLVSADINITLNNFRYTCLKPGAFSIVLTVYDKANNSAKARKIFNYDNHNSSVQETDFPVYLDKANPTTNYLYITDLDKLQNPTDSYQFSLVWTGHFETTYKQQWLGAVKQWTPDSSGTVIDDNYGVKYGLRSIDKVPVPTGLLGYELAYSVDTSGRGGVGLSPPSDGFTPITDATATSAPVTVTSALKDGDAIVTWLRFYDLYGKAGVVRRTTYVDTSRFNIELKSSAEFKKHYPEQYNSSVVINVRNSISGIRNITYQVKDVTRNLIAYSGFTIPQVLDPPSSFPGRRRRDAVEMPCNPNDRTCYCIPSGQCFNVTQLINMDNCWIDKGVAGDRVTISYTIVTYSGYTLGGDVDAGVLSLEDIPCRPVPSILSQQTKIGIAIAVVIICILLILLIVLLILMCIRWKVYHKHPVPSSIRTTYHHIHNRFGRKPDVVIMSENEVYTTKDDFETTKSTTNESSKTAGHSSGSGSSSSSGHWTVSEKDVQTGSVVGEGRFAAVRKGFVSRGNEQIPVAVKILRSGYDKGDPEVMRSKIAFMANKVKPHPNIIRFLGSIAEDKNQASPVMLLELCDKSLKDWLSEIRDVSGEVFENMFSFTLQIARGVKHLHEQGIVHRRLAVRNVLLKQTIGGFEAKLIGFGPAKDDDQHANGESAPVVPIKWMAPETLERLDSGSPVYTKETDVWSYGITAWEIFSKGEAPYANYRSSEISAALKRGERLTCPEHCPPDLFNQVLHPCWNSNPRKRPNFSKICSTIDQFHNGRSSVYYAAGIVPGNRPPPPTGYYSQDALHGNASRLNNSTGLYSEARSA